MGFLSPKAVCAVCGKECGLNRFRLQNKEWCCPDCFKAAGFKMSTQIGAMTAADVRAAIESRGSDRDLLAQFHITQQVPGFLCLDDDQKLWYTPVGSGGKKHPRIFHYADIVDYELLEDGNTLTKGGLGRAVAGGLLFGGVGAVVGGVTGKKHGKSTCSQLQIKITVNNVSEPTEYITFISSEIKKDGMIYKTMAKQAQECLSLLQVICASQPQAEPEDAPAAEPASVADELLKFKQLLDMGAITQEEFDAQKKQLLGK